MIRRYGTAARGPFERCAAHATEADALDRLIEVVGEARFRKVQALFGGRRVWIPKPGAELPCRRCPERDQKIAKLRREGWEVDRLALRFGLSSKRVYGILAEGGRSRSCPKRELWPPTGTN